MKIPEENKNDFSFIFNGFILKTDERSKLYEKGITSGSIITVTKNNNMTKCNNIEGKILNVNAEYKNEIVLVTNIGTLNKIKDLCALMENDLSSRNIFIKKIKINKKIYERDDERTFSSVGVLENFTCEIEALNINEKKNCNIY